MWKTKNYKSEPSPWELESWNLFKSVLLRGDLTFIENISRISHTIFRWLSREKNQFIFFSGQVSSGSSEIIYLKYLKSNVISPQIPSFGFIDVKNRIFVFLYFIFYCDSLKQKPLFSSISLFSHMFYINIT